MVIRTRPDALFATTVLAARASTATELDMEFLKRVIRYLYATVNDGLLYRADSVWELYMSVDASFNLHWDAKGQSGYVVFGSHGSAGVLYKSTKQKVVTDSSTESELVALHDGVKYLLWINSIYGELGYSSEEKIVVEQDNEACILLSSADPVNFRGKSKFINRKYFSIFEHVRLSNRRGSGT